MLTTNISKIQESTQIIIQLSKNSQQNSAETVTNGHDKDIPKEWYISPEESKK